MGSPPDTTTLRLRDTAAGVRSKKLWLMWVNVDGALPVPLDGGCVIGRGADADARLECAGVSRRHLELYRQGPLFGVRDLDSTNGTFLNGQRLEPAAALTPNDVLRLGEAVAVVVSCEGERPPPRPDPALKGLILGPGMAEVQQRIQQVASGMLAVVLEGPTGSGKEGLARLLHEKSGRRGKLLAVNCAAVPSGLAEAELFGYRKGAFTGADQAALGHVRAAHEGTLFLDELADLARPVQAKLLRVIQEQQVVPLGETRPVPVDFRLVVASPVPIAELVQRGDLREDLAARLSGIVISVPRLRERRADIALLLTHFLDRYSGGRAPAVDARLLEQLLLLDWPGNVRELEQLTRRLLALHGAEAVLRRSHWDGETRVSLPPPPRPRASKQDASDDLARLRAAFARHRNLTRAAREAGISRQRAYRLLGDGAAASLLGDEQTGLAQTDAEPADRGETGP